MFIIPRTTEKAYSNTTKNTYMFNVLIDASKQAIAKAVSEEYKVTVLDVRTLVRDGKPKRYSRGRRAYPGTTYLQDKKIAYVTLKAGDKIPVFEEETEKTEALEKEVNKNTVANDKKGDK